MWLRANKNNPIRTGKKYCVRFEMRLLCSKTCPSNRNFVQHISKTNGVLMIERESLPASCLYIWIYIVVLQWRYLVNRSIKCYIDFPFILMAWYICQNRYNRLSFRLLISKGRTWEFALNSENYFLLAVYIHIYI